MEDQAWLLQTVSACLPHALVMCLCPLTSDTRPACSIKIQSTSASWNLKLSTMGMTGNQGRSAMAGATNSSTLFTWIPCASLARRGSKHHIRSCSGLPNMSHLCRMLSSSHTPVKMWQERTSAKGDARNYQFHRADS